MPRFLLFLPEGDQPQCIIECNHLDEFAGKLGCILAKEVGDEGGISIYDEWAVKFPHPLWQLPLPTMGLEAPNSFTHPWMSGVWYFQSTRWVFNLETDERRLVFLSVPFRGYHPLFRLELQESNVVCRLRRIPSYTCQTNEPDTRVGAVP